MPSRKQRRRELKQKRHEYEFVYVDGEGNELEELPEGFEEEQKERSPARNGSKPAAKKQPATRANTRSGRTPPVPSWNRALKRGALLGIVVFALFSFTAKGHWASVLPLALLYTVLFVPFTYVIDRFAYKRYQARLEAGPSVKTAKKR